MGSAMLVRLRFRSGRERRRRSLAVRLSLAAAALSLASGLTFAAAARGGAVGALRRRAAAGLLVAWPAAARAEIVQLKNNPLPKSYYDDVVGAAIALKEALVAEEAVEGKQLSAKEEADVAAKEQKAGKAVRRYGETYLAEGNMKAASLKDSPVFYFMGQAIDLFRLAMQRESEGLPRARPEIIKTLDKVLEYAELAGAS